MIPKLIICLGGFAFRLVFLGSIPIYLLLFLLIEVVLLFRALVCYNSVVSSILLMIYLIVYVGAIMVIFGYVCSLLPSITHFSPFFALPGRSLIFVLTTLSVMGFSEGLILRYSNSVPLDLSAFVYQSSFIFIFV
jgi:hypothetical protein